MTDTTKPAYKNRISYHAILLGGFATLSAALLIIGNMSTSDDIKKQVMEDTRKSISQVIPEELRDNNLMNDIIKLKYKNQNITVYRAKQKNKITAVAYQIRGQGYGGEILLIMGIKADGTILGVRVLSHSETPGLGDKIEEKKSRWIYGFNGLSLNNVPISKWAVKKDGGRFDQFSGATITPRGVVNAIKGGLYFFKAKREELVQLNTKQTTKTEKTK